MYYVCWLLPVTWRYEISFWWVSRSIAYMILTCFASIVGIWKAGNYCSIHTFSDCYIFDLASSLDTLTGGLYSWTIKKFRFLDSSILTELLWKRLLVFRSTHFVATFEIPTVAAGMKAALGSAALCSPGTVKGHAGGYMCVLQVLSIYGVFTAILGY